METSDLLKKVRKIEIKTRGLSSQIFSGEYHSAFKGRGMAFSEVREYAPGDDVRTIDWNVTARFSTPYVKVFEEERELNVLRIIRDLIEFKPENKKTNLELALKYLTNVIKKKSIVFLISDFFVDQNYRDALKIANKKHDLVALRIIDTKETELPNVGLVKLKDNETGKLMWVDTNDKAFRKQFAVNHLKFEADLKENFNRSGIDATNIFTHENYVKPLMNLFKNR